MVVERSAVRPIDGPFARHRTSDAGSRRRQSDSGATPDVGRTAMRGGGSPRSAAMVECRCFGVVPTVPRRRPPLATMWLAEKNRTPPEWRAVSRFWRISNAYPMDELKLGVMTSVEGHIKLP